jgi:hypothetical protein
LDNIYNFEEHIHRFACWTAARAASIGRYSNEEIKSIIDRLDLRGKILQLKQENIDHALYTEWFKGIVIQVKEAMQEIKKEDKLRNISFGIAAKVVSIYVKTAEVMTTDATSRLSEIAFPPLIAFF